MRECDERAVAQGGVELHVAIVRHLSFSADTRPLAPAFPPLAWEGEVELESQTSVRATK